MSDRRLPDFLVAELQRLGVAEYHVEHGSKMKHLVCAWQGGHVRLSFGHSCRWSGRYKRNVLTTLRRLLNNPRPMRQPKELSA